MKTAALAMGMLVTWGNLALADMAATVNVTPDMWTNVSGGISLGWRFFADRAFTVTHLGLFDLDLPGVADTGLATTHTMGIWRLPKEGGFELLRQVNIGPGIATETIGHHVYVDIPDLTIVPDHAPAPGGNLERWLIGVWSPSNNLDNLLLSPDSVTMDIAKAGIIRLEDYTFSDPRVLEFPGIDPYYWAPWGETSTTHSGINFQYTLVPAPGAVLLGMIGLGHAGLRLRRRRL